jgi:kynurenine formamidase
VVLNDDIVELATQGSSQWDTFAHCGVIAPGKAGVFLGGVGLEETLPGGMPPRLGLGAFGAGVVTRGVLIDTVALLRSEVGHLEETDRVSRADVEECLRRQGSELHRGDVVFLYTGFGRRYSMSDDAMPKVAGGIDGSTMPLWSEAGVAALVSDNIAVEASPANFDVHIACLVEFGIALGELWALEELATACREDGVYEFLLVSVPLNLPYAFGSPANAVAIR